MSYLCNLHTHTCFGDGQGQPEEFVLAAIAKGFAALGFSEHAYAPYDGECCIPLGQVGEYCREIKRLKREYAGKIEIYLGLENDSYCPSGRQGCDFLIGSVHYLRDGAGRYYVLDYLPSLFEQALIAVGGGDMRLLAARYYQRVAMVATGQKPDILGHFDLLRKLNRGNRYFDPQAGWYLDIVRRAVDEVARSGCVVEVNSGGMSRGYTDEPYPCRDILSLLHSAGVAVTLCSDAHRPQDLDFAFEDMRRILLDVGYRKAMVMKGGRLTEVEL